MQLLQNKLDDSVLDVISVQLIRNPMSKLAPEDVHVCIVYMWCVLYICVFICVGRDIGTTHQESH